MFPGPEEISTTKTQEVDDELNEREREKKHWKKVSSGSGSSRNQYNDCLRGCNSSLQAVIMSG